MNQISPFHMALKNEMPFFAPACLCLRSLGSVAPHLMRRQSLTDYVQQPDRNPVPAVVCMEVPPRAKFQGRPSGLAAHDAVTLGACRHPTDTLKSRLDDCLPSTSSRCHGRAQTIINLVARILVHGLPGSPQLTHGIPDRAQGIPRTVTPPACKRCQRRTVIGIHELRQVPLVTLRPQQPR